MLLCARCTTTVRTVIVTGVIVAVGSTVVVEVVFRIANNQFGGGTVVRRHHDGPKNNAPLELGVVSSYVRPRNTPYYSTETRLMRFGRREERGETTTVYSIYADWFRRQYSRHWLGLVSAQPYVFPYQVCFTHQGWLPVPRKQDGRTFSVLPS